jgi:hypothetical protein
MNKQNPSHNLAARTRSGNLLAWLLPGALIPALLMLVLAGGGTASAQVVTNTADSGPGTLRSAITNAASGAVITFDPSLAGVALRSYAMDLATNDPEQIRLYLAQNHAPADFVLPAALKQAALAGCAVEGWQTTRVSMICFRTGKAVAAGGSSDLWLFVVDRNSVRGAPAGDAPQFDRVNRLMTAIWAQGDKLYLLGTEGDERAIKQYL